MIQKRHYKYIVILISLSFVLVPFCISIIPKVLYQPGLYTVPIWSPDSQMYIFQTDKNNDHSTLWLNDNSGAKSLELDVLGDINLNEGASWINNNEFLFITLKTDFSVSPIVIRKRLYLLDTSKLTTELKFEYTTEWFGYTFNSVTNQFVYSEYVDNFGTLKTLNLTNGESVPLLEEQQNSATYPLWSPDGEKLAFISKKRIGVYEPATGTKYIDASIRGGANRMAWSPDGDSLLVVGTSSMQGLYLIDVNTGDNQLVLEGDFSYVSWSPDGSQIAYTTLGVPGKNELFIVDAYELNLKPN